MMMANANLDAQQKISVLAASSPSDAAISATATTDDFIKAIKYESIASVIRQCEKQSVDTLNASTSTTLRRSVFRTRGARRTPQEIEALKQNSQCRKCNQWGHWHSDHFDGGSLKPGTKSRKSKESTDAGKKTQNGLSFNMATLSGIESALNGRVGPLCDDGAPYCGIGLTEFELIQPYVASDFKGTFDELPESVKSRPLWQYGSGKHKNEVRRIIGSLFLTAMSDSDNPIRMRHLIVEGSSQWVIGRNVTKSSDILHIDTNVLKLPDSDTISLVESDMHSFIPYESFCTRRRNGLLDTDRSAIFCAAGMLHSSTRSLSWSDTKKIVDKVHRHVCGHSSYSDIKILFWSATVFGTKQWQSTLPVLLTHALHVVQLRYLNLLVRSH